MIFILLLIATSAIAAEDCNPHGIHLALGEAYWKAPYPYCDNANPNCTAYSQAEITFTTVGACKGVNTVSAGGVTYQSAIDTNFVDGAYARTAHTFKVGNLSFETPIQYSVQQNGADVTGAGPFTFTLPKPTHHQGDRPFKFATFGDWDIDTIGAITKAALESQVEKPTEETFDMIYFLGDMAYEINDNNGKKGDDFLDGIQKIASHWPYMITLGNHEKPKNYGYANYRFRMPQFETGQNHFFSFNVGPVHFINFDFYFWSVYSNPSQKQEYQKWLENDLIVATKPENRELRPWIVIVNHEPIYCSDLSSDSDCKKTYGWFTAVEEIIAKYQVDLFISGHQHNYERTLPIIHNETSQYETQEDQDKWLDKTDSTYYVDPEGPVYAIVGSAGNHKQFANTDYELANYSSYMDANLGYSVVTAHNRTHLQMDFVQANTTTVVDTFWIIKDQEDDEYDGEHWRYSHSAYMGLLVIAGLISLGLIVVGAKRVFRRKEMTDLQIMNEATA